MKEAALLGLILIATGKATAYGEGLMERVVENRVMWKQIDTSLPHNGYVALADKKYLGQRVMLELPDGRVVGPFMVADCGKETDQERLREIGFAVDLSYPLAQELEATSKPIHGVRVWLISDGNERVQ